MEFELAREAQRLTEHYSQMYDGELLNLADDSADLTEIAQQVLRDELKKRGLSDPRERRPPAEAPKDANRLSPLQSDNNLGPSLPEDANQENDLPREYTWKTLLCECEDREQAWQMSEALRRAGIECWIERPYSKFFARDFQILVAADQLDRAREAAARPIPQDIVDESKVKIPEFELPTCPHCGAPDPVLESVDPSNTWACETCGSQWTESEQGLDEPTEKAES